MNNSSAPAKRKRCVSIHGFFSLTSVCRQTRADLYRSVYQLNSFAFSDKNYNYSRAIHAFTQSLTEQELPLIRTVQWPLASILIYRGNLRGERVEEPDSGCVEEHRNLNGLNRLIFRYGGPELNRLADNHTEKEREGSLALLGVNGRRDYAIERKFRRTLAVRTARVLIARESVSIDCEKNWRAAF